MLQKLEQHNILPILDIEHASHVCIRGKKKPPMILGNDFKNAWHVSKAIDSCRATYAAEQAVETAEKGKKEQDFLIEALHAQIRAQQSAAQLNAAR